MNHAVALAGPWRPSQEDCEANVERVDASKYAFAKLNKDHGDLGIPLKSLMKPTSEEGADGIVEPAPRLEAW